MNRISDPLARKSELDGTPSTLDEAIRNAICIGPMGDTSDRLYHYIYDFLAQNFGVAFLQAKTSTETERLEKLWSAVIARPK